MVCTPCASAGGRNALLPVGTCEGKPGAPQELFQSLPSAYIRFLSVKWWSVVCDGPAILESDFELFFENRLGGFCFAVDAYRWFF